MDHLPNRIESLLEAMEKFQASDLHLKNGVPPVYRIGGELTKINAPAFRIHGREIEALMKPIIPERGWKDWEVRGAIDFAYTLPTGDRFRINVLRSCDHMHAAIRRVNAKIPDFQQLHLPPVYERLASETHEGLVIVCGVTGSGKSSTMAAMIDHINHTQGCHIISIEDPIEYAFKNDKSIISQREIGLDLDTFASGLRSAVREDPDVIFVGELRDKETVLAALQAAETGHLVFGTLHTADSMQSFTRMLEFFPQEQHGFIRSSLANGLQAICAQRLLPAMDPAVLRVPATEVLLAEPIVREKVRDGEDEDLPAIVQSNVESGMHNFNQSLAKLVDQELIYLDTAMEYSPNRDQLRGMVRGIKTSGQTLVSKIRKGG